MEYRDEKSACIEAQVTDKDVSFELKSELSLPDYLGEVSRLLWVRPNVLPPTRFLGGGNAEFSGRICYDALYAGADGKLYRADAEEPYAFSVPTAVTRADMLTVTILPDVMVGRVAAPRKLSLRCRLHAHVCGYEEKSIETVLPPETDENTCRLGDMAECGRIVPRAGDAVELFDEIDVGGEDEVRVISSRAEVFLPDVAARSGAVCCRGEVIVTLLCCKDGSADNTEGAEEGKAGTPYAMVRRLPLSCEIPIEEMTTEYAARAFATVEEVRAIKDGGKLSLAVRVLPLVEAVAVEPVAYTKDLFMPGFDTKCRRSEEKIWVPEICGNKNFSISGTFSGAQLGIPTGAAVIDAVGEAEVKEKSTDGKQIVLTGEIHCHVLWCLGDEFGVGDATLPFRVSTEGRFDALSVITTVPILRVQAERDQLRADAELLLAMRGVRFATVTPVCEASFTAREEKRTADLLLCYPTPGESLWEISRRFAVSPREIAAANGIDTDDMASPQSLSGVKYLMIPDKK